MIKNETLLEQDEDRREANVKSGKPLCPRCDGTGNEFLTVYKECMLCGGSGVLKKPS